MKVLTNALLLATCVALVPVVARADRAAVAATVHDLEHALWHGDVRAMQAARATLVAQSAAAPDDALLHYWVALADWRIVPLLLRTDRARAEALASDGLGQCDQALARRGTFADALAVQASLEGMTIMLHPAEAMTLGGQAEAHLQRALALEPGNLRVWLLDGIFVLNKPAAFGGGAAASEAPLQRACALADSAVAAKPDAGGAPAWGADEAWAWAGRAALERGDRALAKHRFERALAINPDNGWVRNRLLPQALAADSSGSAHPDSSRTGTPGSR